MLINRIICNKLRIIDQNHEKEWRRIGEKKDQSSDNFLETPNNIKNSFKKENFENPIPSIYNIGMNDIHYYPDIIPEKAELEKSDLENHKKSPKNAPLLQKTPKSQTRKDNLDDLSCLDLSHKAIFTNIYEGALILDILAIFLKRLDHNPCHIAIWGLNR